MNPNPQYSTSKPAPSGFRWGWFFGIALILLIVLAGWWWVSGQSDPLTSHNISQPLAAARGADIDLSTGVALLNLSAGAPAGTLIEGNVETFAKERLQQDSRVQGGQVFFKLDTKGYSTNFRLAFGRKQTPNWNLRLTPKVPIYLKLSTGVGESKINLTGLTISGLNLTSGVGQTTLTLPNSGNFSGEVSAGVGEAIVRVPASLAVRIRASAGVGGVEVQGYFQRRGDEYVSRNYGSARNRVELKLSGGVGQITVETIP